MIISATNAGVATLAKVNVIPFLRENLSVRATVVEATDGTRTTGPRLRTTHLIPAAPQIRAAAKDVSGIWSEWSESLTPSLGNFTAGSSVGSIGSGVADDLHLQEPAVNFPDLSIGSGHMKTTRTIVDASWMDESRRSKWVRPRSGFRVVLTDLDAIQAELMGRFFRALNGPAKPFFYDFADTDTGITTRYVVRFRDPALMDQLFAIDYSNISFNLSEVIGIGTGDSASIASYTETDFHELPNGAMTTGKWLVGGTGLTVGFDGIRNTTGDSIALWNTPPIVIHQRADITFNHQGGSIGVECRWASATNRVYLIHTGTAVTLYEVIGGTSTSKGTMSASTGKGGMRLEVIGSRARVWYESGDTVTDRPPDFAADLSGTYPVANPYGFFMLSDTAGNSTRITKFFGGELPRDVMPSPYFTVADASGIAMVPLTISVSGNSDPYLELEIVPADAVDIPEAYREICAAFTSKVVFVRAGYPYSIRCRAVQSLGGASPGTWTSHATITAAGTKTLPTAPGMPTIAFPSVTPDYVLERTQTATVNAVISDTGRERTISPWTRTRNSFKLKFENKTDEEEQLLINFFDQMVGQNSAFLWTHPITGEQFAMRFSKDDYEDEGKERGDTTVWWAISFEIMEVNVGGVGVLVIDPTPNVETTTGDNEGVSFGGSATALSLQTPDKLTPWNILWWYDASNVDAVYDGDFVVDWPDVSGQSNGSSGRGVFRTNQFNGRPAVEITREMVISLSPARPIHIFAVQKSGSMGLNGDLSPSFNYFARGFLPLNANPIFPSASPTPDWIMGDDGFGTYLHQAGGLVASMSSTSNEWKLHEVQDDSGSSKYFINGTQVGSTSTSHTSTPSQFVMPVGTLFTEIIAYSGILTPSIRSALISYILR